MCIKSLRRGGRLSELAAAIAVTALPLAAKEEGGREPGRGFSRQSVQTQPAPTVEARQEQRAARQEQRAVRQEQRQERRAAAPQAAPQRTYQAPAAQERSG